MKIISWILLIITFEHVKLGQGEQPLSVCQNGRPFKTMDNSCSNFRDVCVKTGDSDCDNFLKACDQCPPSNQTVRLLSDISKSVGNILKSVVDQQQAGNNTHQLTLKFKQNFNRSFESNNTIVIVILIIAILLFIILLIEIRFRLFTRLCSCINKKYKKDMLGDQRKSKRQNDVDYGEENELLDNYDSKCKKNMMGNEETIETIKLLLNDYDRKNYIRNDETTKTITSLLGKYDETIKKMEELTKTTKHLLDRKLKTRFRIKDNETIEFRVGMIDNVLKVKRIVINKFPNYKPSDYKIMKLKYNEIIFDNNKNFLSYLEKPDVTINCYFDTEINANGIIILRVQSNEPVPEIIQINRFKTVQNLKKLIFENVKDDEIKIFKNLKELEDKLTLDKCDLKDDDSINAIKKITGDVVISSIFDSRDKVAVYFSNFDSVSSLKTNFANKLHLNVENFVFFHRNQHLDENKFIFEYDIDTDSQLNFCSLMKLNDLIIGDQIEKGYYSILLEAEIRSKNQKVVLKKYTQLGIKTFKNNDLLLNELSAFQIVKSHERFLQLYGIYMDDEFFYISMEHLHGMPLKVYISKNHPLDEGQIINLSKQILEGLQFLHDHNIIFRDLKTSNILLGENENIKLPSLTLSKYLHDYEPNPLKATLKNDTILPQRYLAPEILRKETYGIKADIWSFGAILVEMVTGCQPYSNLDEKNAAKKILEKKTILFESNNKSQDIIDFIGSCLVFDPKKRATIEELFNSRFLSNNKISQS